MRLDGVRRDFKPLGFFFNIRCHGDVLVDENLGHHEVGDYGVVLVDRVDTLEISIGESDRRKTLW